MPATIDERLLTMKPAERERFSKSVMDLRIRMSNACATLGLMLHDLDDGEQPTRIDALLGELGRLGREAEGMR